MNQPLLNLHKKTIKKYIIQNNCMKNKEKELTFKFIKEDLPSGLVVFLVALPLCLGIALASGAPLFSGIIAGIVGGIVVALASGSNVSVTGPAAGLTVIVLNGIAELGNYNTFLLAVVLAGGIQIVLGFLKAGVIGYYFPSSVIKGMLAAIGIILILKQAPVAIGYVKNMPTPYHLTSIIIASVSILIILIWDLPMIKNNKIAKWIPGALIAVFVGTAINEFMQVYNPVLKLSDTQLVKLPVANSLNDFAQQFTFPDFKGFLIPKVYVLAITIAIIASLESLLSTEAGDKLDPHKRITPTNRELKAQGLGNMISGLIGGLPVTAVIVRTSANVNAGSRTKLSAIFHGVLLLVSVILLASILNKIPLACLAAVLLVVGYKLAKVSLFKQMYKLGWEQFVPFIVTIVAIQFTDLLKGIALGMLVAIFYILRANYRRDYVIHHDKQNKGGLITISLTEHVTFLNKGSLALKLSQIEEGTNVVIDGGNAHYIDLDILEIIYNFNSNAEERKIKVTLLNVPAFAGTFGH
jgi:MFS superfamily sulfate permease-like transporter